MMRAIQLAVACVAVLIATAGQVQAGILTLQNAYALSNQLADPPSNFHPQGLGYDPFANELLFMQQSSFTIFRTDLTGSINGSQFVSRNHTVSAAADANFYYFSDYTSNSSGPDMFRVSKSSGVESQFSSEVVGFGGYPIDVRNGLLYRTEPSNTYNFSNLDQVRVSSTSTPDTVFQTLNFSGISGIGDIAVDPLLGNLWTLDYASNAAIHRFDLATGQQLDTFSLNLDGLTGGLTVTNDGRLFYYDWNSGSGSTLTEYSFSEASAVPEPSSLALFGIGACVAGLGAARRRRREKQQEATA